jgi:hypothetical protein
MKFITAKAQLNLCLQCPHHLECSVTCTVTMKETNSIYITVILVF